MHPELQDKLELMSRSHDPTICGVGGDIKVNDTH